MEETLEAVPKILCRDLSTIMESDPFLESSKVYSRPSVETVQLFAMDGLMWRVGSNSTSPSKISEATAWETVSAIWTGSREGGSEGPRA